jgi:hypothetical protein
MIRSTTLLACTLFVLLGANEARGQGTASWAAGLPKTGSGVGEIDIKGTITADAGWMVTSAQFEAWEDGKVVITGAIFLDATKSFDTAIGLTGGKTYNVVVTANVTNGTVTKFVRTPPKAAMAKAN